MSDEPEVLHHVVAVHESLDAPEAPAGAMPSSLAVLHEPLPAGGRAPGGPSPRVRVPPAAGLPAADPRGRLSLVRERPVTHRRPPALVVRRGVSPSLLPRLRRLRVGGNDRAGRGVRRGRLRPRRCHHHLPGPVDAPGAWVAATTATATLLHGHDVEVTARPVATTDDSAAAFGTIATDRPEASDAVPSILPMEVRR